MRVIPRRKVELTFGEIYSGFKNLFIRKRSRDNLISQFEEDFEGYIGTKHALVLPSVRSGLSLFLDTMAFEENDEVLMASYNYHVVAALFKNKKLKPIFIDVGPETWNIDPTRIEQNITPKTKILVATHLFGKSCPMDDLMRICKKHSIMLIEDVAHACGGEYKGKKLGSFGDVAFFSFGTGKAIVALGGGMLTTNNDSIAHKMRTCLDELKITKGSFNLAKYFKPIVETVLTNKIIFAFIVYPILYVLSYFAPQFVDKLTEDKFVLAEGNISKELSSFSWFQATLGLEQLKKLEQLNSKRRSFAALLNELLKDLEQIRLPAITEDQEHTGLYYGLVTQKVKELRRYLFLRGVDTKLGSMKACSALDFFESDHSCPVAESLSPHIIELPCYPSLDRKDIYNQANLIRSFYGKERIELAGQSN